VWAEPVFEVMLAGALAGLVGVHVVQRKLSFFTMALTHATFPGVVAAAIIGVNILIGGVVAGSLVAVGVAWLSRRRGQNAAAATGVVLSAGFALGAGLVATQSGFSQDLSSLLVGSIVTVGRSDLVITAIALAVVALVLLAGRRPLRFIGFDRDGARAAGYAVGAWDLVLLLTVQVVVVAVVPAVGTILAVALLVAPAAAARQWSSRPAVVSALAVTFAVGAGFSGLWTSGRFAIAAGAGISLAATMILLVSTVAVRLRRRFIPEAAALSAAGNLAPVPVECASGTAAE
jgi:ABC-type Mn2+/Zn2+ transport system permease subunit